MHPNRARSGSQTDIHLQTFDLPVTPPTAPDPQAQAREDHDRAGAPSQLSEPELSDASGDLRIASRADAGERDLVHELAPTCEQEPSPTDLLSAWCSFARRWVWDLFGTFTFRGDAVHPEAADKMFRVWVSKVNRQLYGSRWAHKRQGLTWLRALEVQRRGTVHFHALLAGPGLRELWEQSWYRNDLGRWANKLMDIWDELAGYARLEVPRSAEAVTGYCSKYILKGGELELGGPLWRRATYTLPLVRSSNLGPGAARRTRFGNHRVALGGSPVPDLAAPGRS